MERVEEMDLPNQLKSILCPPCCKKVVRSGIVGDVDGPVKEGYQAQGTSGGESFTIPVAVNPVLLDGHQHTTRPAPGLTICNEQLGKSGDESSNILVAVKPVLLDGVQHSTRPAPGLTLCNEQEKQEWRDFFTDEIGVDYQNVRFLRTRLVSTNSDSPPSSISHKQQSEEEGPSVQSETNGKIAGSTKNNADTVLVRSSEEEQSEPSVVKSSKRYSLRRAKWHDELREKKDRGSEDSCKAPSNSCSNQGSSKKSHQGSELPEDRKSSEPNPLPHRAIIPGRDREEGPKTWWRQKNKPSHSACGPRQNTATNSQKRDKGVQTQVKTVSSAMEKMEAMVLSLSDSFKNALPRQLKSLLNLYFLDFSINRQPMGKVIIETDPDMAPFQAANFATLCTMDKGSYKGCRVFRCVRMKYLITGDNENNDGSDGKSVVLLRHGHREFSGMDVVRSSVAMVHKMVGYRSINTSQFKIIVNDQPEGDEDVFGRVVAGMELVDKIVALGSNRGRPKKSVVITECGKYE